MANYQSVFGNQINEEVAIRIFNILTDKRTIKQIMTYGKTPLSTCRDPDEMNRDWRKTELKALYNDQIGILAFFNRIIQIRDPCLSNVISFRFLDFDDSGALGSIDILNLSESFEHEEMENVQKLFLEERVKRTLAIEMARKLCV